MPIYEFTCLDCRYTFDVFGGYASRSEPQVCPKCESTSTQALFSRFASIRGSSESASSETGGCACGGACSCAN